MSVETEGSASCAMDDRLAARLRRAVPSARIAFWGAGLWALLMAASALVGISHWATVSHIVFILALYGAGAAMAFPLALLLARFASEGKSRSQSFAITFLALAFGTIGLTALLFAFDYRSHYAEWHAETFSLMWSLQLVFTLASAVYQFAVIGLRLYFPVGLIALFAASLWFATRPR